MYVIGGAVSVLKITSGSGGGGRMQKEVVSEPAPRDVVYVLNLKTLAWSAMTVSLPSHHATLSLVGHSASLSPLDNRYTKILSDFI